MHINGVINGKLKIPLKVTGNLKPQPANHKKRYCLENENKANNNNLFNLFKMKA